MARTIGDKEYMKILLDIYSRKKAGNGKGNDLRVRLQRSTRDYAVMQVGKRQIVHCNRKVQKWSNWHWMQPIRTTRGVIISDRNHS